MGDVPLVESANEPLLTTSAVRGEGLLFPAVEARWSKLSDRAARSLSGETLVKDTSIRSVAQAVPDDGAAECIVLKEPPSAQEAMLAISHAEGAKLIADRKTVSVKSARPTIRSMPRPAMPELPARGEIAALARTSGTTLPRRIGRGQLVTSRMNWRPGDPFGDRAEKARGSLRWERVIATTCVTAACGMACVWILTTLFT